MTNKNTNAYSHMKSTFNLYGTPTNYFDGGYDMVLGAGSIPSAKAAYEAAINNSGARLVPDIEATLSVKWLLGARMHIDLSIENHDGVFYNGYVRVFVTELEASIASWVDGYNDPYTFAFLDFAFNESITIAGGSTWQKATDWDGAMHSDGYGNTFNFITPDNIMVIAAVYDSTPHQKYSYPPNTAPYNAYYLDESVATMPVAEFFVDNGDPECVVLSGQWKEISHPNAYNGTTLYTPAGTGGKRVGFRVDELVQAPGPYEVQVRKFEHPYMSQMATRALHKVYHMNGQSAWIPVDLSTPGNQWISLGTYDFDDSKPQGVLIVDYADGIVTADAIRMIPR